MNETLTTLNTRRSIRRYRPEQVRPETLDAILEAGTYAPSAMGKQSAVMAVVQDPETIALLSRLNAEIQGRPGTDPFYGAPTVVVVLADGETYNWMRDGSLVMGNLMNAAWSLGVGPAGSTGPRSCSTARRARSCWPAGGCRPPSGAWATASWAIRTGTSPPPSPGNRTTSSGSERRRPPAVLIFPPAAYP